MQIPNYQSQAPKGRRHPYGLFLAVAACLVSSLFVGGYARRWSGLLTSETLSDVPRRFFASLDYLFYPAIFVLPPFVIVLIWWKVGIGGNLLTESTFGARLARSLLYVATVLAWTYIAYVIESMH